MLEMNSRMDDSACRARRDGNGSTTRPSGPYTTERHEGSKSVRTSDNLRTVDDLVSEQKVERV